MRQFRTTLLAIGIGILAAGAAAAASGEPPAPGGSLTLRRLNEGQYTRSIQDIFGAGIEIPGRFDPPRREDGLLAIGDSGVILSSSGFEQSELRARKIAEKLFADDKRKNILSCAPKSPTAFDKNCASQFVTKYGRLLYRRPLDPVELNSIVGIARTATEQSGNFNKGLEVALARMLASPNFLFRTEEIDPSSARHGEARLSDYSLASRISFLLWDAPPDEALLDAAAHGELRNQAGLQKQVDRLIQSPRFEQGARSFFSDMFGYEQFDGLVKDQTMFPVYSSFVAQDAKEQTLRTVVDLLVKKNGDYRDLFTTKQTFINRRLGALYQVAVEVDAVDGWAPYTFQPEDQRAGLLSLAAFLMLDPSHEARSSPTIRGKAVRELLLCQAVPPPPKNVDFSLVQDTQNAIHKTARERLTAHRENPTCAGCHAITDPIGLSMETYNAVGELRLTENGAPIDTSGTFDGKPYKNAIELEQIMHDSPAVTDCVARRAYEYGLGRTMRPSDHEWLKYLQAQFAGNGFKFETLMRTIATSNAFAAVTQNTASN